MPLGWVCAYAPRVPTPVPLAFRWPWRDYQERLVAELPTLLSDRRLHVVAAPGSGKTVIGIEAVRTVGRPAVVLSPTRTIRDQWLERLEDFLPSGAAEPDDWTSRDLSDLRWFSSLTYQALHTRTRAEQAAAEEGTSAPTGGEVADVATMFREAGIGTIVLDEAHHLRADWWAALTDLVARLDDVTLVSLTATPPYDVPRAEWDRYIALCGPIDTEIAAPELVKAGTLCPHDDGIWLSTCLDTERGALGRHRRTVQALTLELVQDPAWVGELAAHPWVVAPQEHLRQIAATPDTALALLSLLRQTGRPCEGLLDTFGLDVDDVRSLEPGQWELLLAEYLFGAEWPGGPDQGRRRDLAQRLRRDGLLWRRELSLVEAGRGWPDLGLSPAKIRSCVELHRLERRERGAGLRQVVLTDHVRFDEQAAAAALPAGTVAERVGAWPIFRALLDDVGVDSDVARSIVMHTGQHTLVHGSLLPHVVGDGTAGAGTAGALTTRPVPGLDGWLHLDAAGGRALNRALTHLLTSGLVHVVVGTRALLGEGWDAPAVNSLVIASTADASVATNQMRGRAIRTDPRDPTKTASIWHLATVAEVAPGQWDLRDLDDLTRRFDAFMGLAAHEPSITAGLSRLETLFEADGVPTPPVDVAGNNDDMAARLTRRSSLAARWQTALATGRLKQTVPVVRVPAAQRLRPLPFGSVVPALGGLGAGIGVGAVGIAAGLANVFVVGLGLAAVSVVPLGRAAWRSARHLGRGGPVRALGRAVRDALVATGDLPPALADAQVVVNRDGSVLHAALSEGTFAQQSLFAGCLAEALGPVVDPRYLVRAQLLGLVRYHAVPRTFGTNASRAAAYLDAWHRHVGGGQLVHTRNLDGRHHLLRAQHATRGQQAARSDRWL